MTTTRGPGLYEFLIEAELQQYYSGIKNDLKVQNVSQLKYVTEEDLQQIGMTKPEMRRLKKFFQRHFPQNYISKLKKMIRPKKEEPCSMQSLLPDDNTEKPAIRVPNKHIIPAEAIIVNKELGAGEFGVVQQGVWTNDRDRIQVAIKCLSRERMQNNPIEFLKEAAIMHGIDHEHIVRLYGVVLDTSALMLVTELAPLRSLLECLKEPSLRASFPVLSLCDFAIQVCDGMQYLETKRLIHRDLAARNILVFSKNKVKISDFGLSRALGVGKDYYQTNFNVNLKLPIAWCAPECISYLRFTSASDVWAYGVTLWEMFSYGFQPWAALTGHQILEAIDEPNFQRLEQPECCPKEYYSVMLKCWQHDPSKRPRFCDLMDILPECKPEQVQAVHDALGEGQFRREQLLYRVGDVITVIDKLPLPAVTNVWKGVLSNGKTGLFNPAHTVAYIGNNLPAANMPGEFTRGDGRNTFSSRRRLRPEMISRPQGDLQHCGHVGRDGAYFGDISFMGGKQYSTLPRQVVTPYKPQEDTGCDTSDVTDRAPLLKSHGHGPQGDGSWSDFPDSEDVPPMSKHLAKYSPPKISHPVQTPVQSGLQSFAYESSLSSSPPAANTDQFGALHKSDHASNQHSNQMISVSSGGPNISHYGSKQTAHHRAHNGTHNRSTNKVHSENTNGIQNSAKLQKGHGSSSHHGSNQSGQNMAHEYHEISDEEEAVVNLDKTYELGSLLTEMESAFPSLGSSPLPSSSQPPPSPLDEDINFRNEQREIAAKWTSGRKKQATLKQPFATENRRSVGGFAPGKLHVSSGKLRFAASRLCFSNRRQRFGVEKKLNRNLRVKPISASDERTLDSAIAMVNEIAARSMEGSGHGDDSPKTPASPNKRKFSFRFPPSHTTTSHTRHASLSRGSSDERRNFTAEAASIPDMQSTLSAEAKAVYSSLVENAADEAAGVGVASAENNPLRMLRSVPVVRPRVRGNKHQNNEGASVETLGSIRSLQRSKVPPPLPPIGCGSTFEEAECEIDHQETAEQREDNPIPLPPRDRTRPQTSSSKARHQRKHPLIIPANGMSRALAMASRETQSSDQADQSHAGSHDDSYDERLACEIDRLDDLEIDATDGAHEEASLVTLDSGMGNLTVGDPVFRLSDHVSCEDLLEFACDGPNSRRTRGKARGVDSDEVRIMGKVLGNNVHVDACLNALNAADWDVHRAIKLVRLQALLQSSLDLADCGQALDSCGWDVARAASWLLANSDVGETTHV
ncbi:activated Cdc42 kinase-like isoform X4 [Thrips palmi]|uniref:non-specific protein-tyrosine kinase n=1 Tax=Thrips palmi TaxID=161013 RepID=A0A6P8YN49_THRPL|nr:activated Cdc42 kinase-like isoform X4 [Thrips palmi]